MKSSALALSLALVMSATAAGAEEANSGEPGWDGDRGLHLGRDGRWHRGWGDADRVVSFDRSRDVDATGTVRCSGPHCSEGKRR